MPKPQPSLVRVYPRGAAYIEGVPHVVQDVDAETAARLCAPVGRHGGAAVFTTDPRDITAGYEPPDPDGLLSTPPAAPVADTQPVEA